jgi:hypothetical protein
MEPQQFEEQDDGFGEFRLGIIQDAESLLEEWVWSITNLGNIGIPLKEAITTLFEYERLNLARMKAESSITIFKDYANGEELLDEATDIATTTYYLKKFRGFAQYLEVLWRIVLARRYPDAGYPRIKVAATLYTQGKLAGEQSIPRAAEGFLRYEIWRGEEYRNAFIESLKKYQKPRGGHARFLNRIDALLEQEN